MTPVLDDQLERTALAQNRTGLSTLMLSFALLRFASFRGSALGMILSVIAAIVSLVELLVSRTSYRSRQADDSGSPRRLGAALVSALAVTLVASAGLVISLG
ncbi:MAG: DUF202 domain-containing protein [Acidimicrobiia bacterium]|nr:DUF202 domain-containing protein [Acidimicrobiia bacterium]